MASWQVGSVMWRNGSRLLTFPVAVARVSSIGVGSVSSDRGPLSTFQEKPRTSEDLPHVSLLELLYRLTFQGFYSRLHELQLYEKKLYGPIYRDGTRAICVNTPELLEAVLRNEDKFPERGDMSLWKDYRDMRGYGYGPFTENGKKWYNLRAVLNKRMLLPKDAAQYVDTLNGVVTDFMSRMSYLRQCSPTGDLVTNMANELYRFSLEAVASILLETRLGCLERQIPAGTQEFINAISMMFSNNFIVAVTPKWTRSLLPYWGRYIAGWDGIFTFAIKLIDKKMKFIQQRLDSNQRVEGEYLTYLLSSTDMSTEDVYGSVTELLLAGVDTTSNTLTWALHLLSMYPENQEKLYKEVSTLVPPNRIPSAEEITQMPYLKAVIKESLRMYPVVPLNGRVVADKAVRIGVYHFSKNTAFTLSHYAISHDEDTFPDSFTFKPERWLRDGHSRPNAFGSIPFGFGVRGCVGRRIAELEMYLLLFRLIRRFEVKPDPEMGELKCITRTVLVPDKPVGLHFVDRRGENTT
ncbi:sterol 26-hydroxylase, mitochondrial [Antennarius striatus]|uniref:sterol 26-hydroxylase, mitochondrial n=1 Tax=Antennarius striatus TaxID=241820 RepID=UPI0035AF4F17